MENQIYRVNLEKNINLEMFIVDANEIRTYKDIKEMAVQVIVENKQLDGSLDLNELDSLIKYLNDCREYIVKFNDASIPEIE